MFPFHSCIFRVKMKIKLGFETNVNVHVLKWAAINECTRQFTIHNYIRTNAFA